MCFSIITTPPHPQCGGVWYVFSPQIILNKVNAGDSPLFSFRVDAVYRG